MDENRGARQAINLDHERRLLDLEREFREHGRVTALEREMNTLTPQVDEMLLARRVSAGVSAELKKGQTTDLNRWTKLGIGAAIATSVGSFILAIVQAWPG